MNVANAVKDYDWVRANTRLIHYFGLGFIQVKLDLPDMRDGEHRLHFYTADLPSITGDEEVHNHRRSFTSNVIRGSFAQKFYSVERGSTHWLEQESCKAGVEAPAERREVGLEETSRHHYKQGSCYWVHHSQFHRVWATGPAVTHLHLSRPLKEYAEVVREVGAEKVCPFSKTVKEDQLWEIVKRMLA